MSNKQKREIIRGATKVLLFLATAASIFLIIGSVLTKSVLTFTFNWVELLLGIMSLYALFKLYVWFSNVEKTEESEDNE